MNRVGSVRDGASKPDAFKKSTDGQAFLFNTI